MTVVRKKDIKTFFFLKPSLDISQLTSVAVKSLLLSRPKRHKYLDMWGFVKTRPLYVLKPPAYGQFGGF